MPPTDAAPEPGTGLLFDEPVDVADVVVDVDAPDLEPSYTYRVPEEMGGAVQVGSCVYVPFGGQERIGYVVGRRTISGADPMRARLRDLIALLHGAVTFDEQQAATARWLSDRYVCHLADAVRCIAPANMAPRAVTRVWLASDDVRADDAGGSVVQAHVIEALRGLGGRATLEELKQAANVSSFSAAYSALKRKGGILERREVDRPAVVSRTVRAYEAAADPLATDVRLSAAGERIMRALADLAAGGATPALPETVLTAAQASASALKTLVDRGLVVVRMLDVRRAPVPIPATRTRPPTFTPGQQAAVEELGRIVAGPGNPPTALLFGVTASGKTEVYLDAIDRTMASGRSAIVLVPEIALTTQVVEVFTGRFGDSVAVLHSRLSEGERHDEWRRLQDGRARIAVGARSAVFAPVRDLGLIVIDEEHEASYKQESLPRYHARDVAVERARLSGASVVLGSATPSVECYHAAEQGRIHRIGMPERIDNRPLPVVRVVDLREEFKERRALFSQALVEELGETLARKHQAILFLNRRGYAQFILCRDCGYVARCPNCAVSLTFHAAWSSLRCHHCDYSRSAPEACPECGGTRIRGFGIGTEKVEEEVLRHFPDARVVRLDRDTTARKGAHAGILRQFRHGEADILIGTQMVAKGLDFPRVTLVGVISADTSINMPDFRAAERTFQLLTQVAGRAGRGEHPGTVIVQTFSPDHYSVERATHQDYAGFYAREIAFREELRYPPFSRLANLVCTDADPTAARDRADRLAAVLRDVLPQGVELLGPAPAPLAKLKGNYRRHVVLRAPVDAPLPEAVRVALARMPSGERVGVTVDIDPASLV